MRVIGTTPEGERQIVCSKCCWRLAYVPSDIHHVEKDYDECEPAYDYITCPKCQNSIILLSKDKYDDDY